MAEGFSLFRVVDEYKGPPLKMVLVGAGSYAMRLLEVPGSEKVVDSIYTPVSESSIQHWVRSVHPQPHDAEEVLGGYSRTSVGRAGVLHVCNCVDMGEFMPLSVVARITGPAPTRVKNQAFIVVGPPNAYDIWRVQLHKLDDVDFDDKNKVEARRFIQDRIVSEVALSLATGISSPLRDEMSEGQYLTKVG